MGEQSFARSQTEKGGSNRPTDRGIMNYPEAVQPGGGEERIKKEQKWVSRKANLPTD